MSDESLIPNKIIPNKILQGEGLYVQAINLVLAKAQRRILIFDQDLRHGDFVSAVRYEILRNFLSTNVASELHIILHDANYFLQKCPRLNNLLRFYPHKMTVYITDDSVKNFKSCFIVVDETHHIKRIHIDQARFKFAIAENIQNEILRQQFLELQTAAHETVSSTTLGL